MPRKDKREEIMKAAAGLFTSRRYHEVTLDEVARIAKVGKGTIYLHFNDKDDLFFQTATHGFDELCESLGNGIPEDAAFAEKILSMCKRIHEFFESRSAFRRVLAEHEGRMNLFRGKMREVVREHRKRLDTLTGAVFAEGVSLGLIRSDLEPEVLARLLMSFIGARARAFDEDPARAPSIETLVDIFLRGVAPPSAGSVPASEASKG